MGTCREIRKQIETLAPMAEVPSWVREHLADCRPCAEGLAAARLASGLLRTAPVVLVPSPGFADRVAARLAAGLEPSPDAGELWRPAWGLMPTFAAILVALVVLQEGAANPEPAGLLPTENATLAEQLLLMPGEMSPDVFLQAVMEEDGQ